MSQAPQKSFAACVKVTRPGATISNAGYHGDRDRVPIPRLRWGVGLSSKITRTALCSCDSDRMVRLLRLTGMRARGSPRADYARFPYSELAKAFRMMQTTQDGMITPPIPFPRHDETVCRVSTNAGTDPAATAI